MIDSTAIISIVDAAFFDSGGRNAGTPFETASTPVIAVQPLANAVSSRNSESGWNVDGAAPSATGSACTVPPMTCHAPRPTSVSVVTMKKYVGTAKMLPDSRMPRRFPIISSATNPSVSSTRLTCQSGNAEVIAATPAAMLTATVRM